MRARPRTPADGPAQPARGFPRWAWWTLFLATFLFAVPATSPWWSTILRSEIPDSPEDEPDGRAAAANPGASAEPSAVPGSMLKVVLLTRVSGGPGLGRVEREIPYVRGVVPQIQSVVSQLAVDSPEVPALLPPGTRVLDVAFAPSGTAYVDFSTELEQGIGMGAEEETTLIHGIVSTITLNFGAVRQVVILVDGKTPKPGHLDLTRPLRRDDPSFSAEDEVSTEGESGTPASTPSPGSKPSLPAPLPAASRLPSVLPPS